MPKKNSNDTPSLFLEQPREIQLHIMSFLGTRKNLNALGKTCKALSTLSKEEELQKYFTIDFSRPDKVQDHQTNIMAMALSNDKKTLAVARRGSSKIDLLNVQTGEIKFTLNNVFDFTQKKDVINLKFMEDDKNLVVTSYYEPIFDPKEERMVGAGTSSIDVWKIKNFSERICKFSDIGKETSAPSFPQTRILSDKQFIVGLFSNSRFTSAKPFYLCDIEKKSAIPFDSIEKANTYAAMALSPDKKIMAHIVDAGRTRGSWNQWKLHAYNIEDGRQIKSMTLNDYAGHISFSQHPNIQFLNDNQTILLGSGQSIHTINLKTEKVSHFPVTFPDYSIINGVWGVWSLSISDASLLPENCVALNINIPPLFLDLKNFTIIWDMEAKKCLATFPFSCQSIIWNDKEKQLIMEKRTSKGGFPYEVSTVKFPHTLKEHLDNDAEKTFRPRR